MKSFVALCFAVLIGLASQPAKAQLSCRSLFGGRPAALELSDVDQRPSRRKVALEKHLPELALWLKARDAKTHQRRLDRLLDFEIDSPLEHMQLNDRVSQLVIEIYGSRALFGSYARADARIKKQALDLVREKVLHDSLQAIASLGDPSQKANVLTRMRASYARFMRDGFGKWLGFPVRLSGARNVELPNELFEKILWDGYDAHADEFRQWIGNRQTAVDAYNLFRRVYSPAVMLAIASFAYVDGRAATIHQLNRQSYEAVQVEERKVDRSVNDLSQLAATAPPAIRAAALQDSLTRFRAKYHEDPTPKELKKIKKRIDAEL